MNAGRKLRRWEKKRQDLGAGDAGIGYTNQNLFRRGEPIRRQNGRCSALFGQSEVGLILGEGQVPWLAILGGRETGELDRVIPTDFSIQMACNFSGGEHVPR